MKQIYGFTWKLHRRGFLLWFLMLALSIPASAQLTGTYTLNSATATGGTNFKSFADLRAALANSSGISSAVTINVVTGSGPYLENVTFPQVVGANATNTITINGNGETIRNASTSIGYVIQMNGADYFRFNNLKIQAANNIAGTRCMHLLNSADNNIVKNCELIISAVTITGASTAYVAFSASATANSAANHGSNNLFEGNKMWSAGAATNVGPYYGVLDFRSVAFGSIVGNNRYIGNEISNVYYYFFYNYYTNGVQVLKNKMHTNRSNAATFWVAYLYYSYVSTVANKFDENEIYNIAPTGTNNGVYLYQVQGTTTLKTTCNKNIYRNCGGTSMYAFRLWYSNYSEQNDNQVYGNAPTNYFYYGIYVSYCDYAETKRNIIRNNTATYLYGTYTNRCNYFTMEGNVVRNNSANYIYYGVHFYYHTNSTCINNAFYNNDAVLIHYYSFYTGYLTNSVVAHNTIVLDDDVDYYYYYAMYHYYFTAPTNVQIKNNIVVLSGKSGYGYSYPMYTPYNAQNIQWGNNVIYDNSPGTKYYNANLAQYASFTLWANVANDKTSVQLDPQFVSKTNNDFRPSNPLLANIGQPGLASVDINMVNRTACGPDPGALEFTIDHAATNFTFGGTNECGNYKEEVTFTFTSSINVAMKDVKVYYAINGGTPVVEYIPNVPAGGSVNYTFKSIPTFNEPGNNVIETGILCDDNSTNNVLKKNIFITQAPHSFDFTEGSTFPGYFKAGTSGGTTKNPDVTATNLEIVYNVSNPTKYPNSEYGGSTGWSLSPKLFTSGGVDLSTSTHHKATYPAGGKAATLAFKPGAALTDSLVFVGYIVKDEKTKCDSVFGRWVYIPPTPNIVFDIPTGCDGDLISFVNKTTQAKGLVEYTWNFGDPNSKEDNLSSISDPVHRFTTFGNFNVTLSAWNVSYPKFVYNLVQTVSISPVPTVCYTVKNACEGTSVQFLNCTSSPVGGTITYAWNFGDGSLISKDKDPTKLYKKAGGYVTTLTATLNGCVSSISKNANQFAMPKADFTVKGNCNLEDVKFTNGTVIALGKSGYSWDFGDNILSNLANPEHAFTKHGTQTVKLTAVSEFGCKNTLTKTFSLNESPKADFTFGDACNLKAVEFIRKGSLPSGSSIYTWNFNNEGISTKENPSYLFDKVGVKDVSLTVSSNNGCTDKITKSFVVKLQAKADFVAQSVCEGEEVVFTNKSSVASGNLNYMWRFGDGTTGTINSPRHGYKLQKVGESETFNITLVALVPGGCSDSLAKSVTVNAKSDATFKPKMSGRLLSIESQATNDPINVYNWRFGDGGKSNKVSPIHEYHNIDNGRFKVCLSIINNAGCLSEHCDVVSVDLLGVLDVNSQKMVVYPNPNNGIFTIQHNGLNNDSRVEVRDAAGKTLSIMNKMVMNGSEIKMDMSQFAAGMYIIQLYDGKTVATQQISITK